MTAAYDPDARRDTALARKLKQRIGRDGPITLADYMHACLADEEHGYYRTRPAIGRGGDFTTAPEISQIFGELIGLWAAVVWQQMGSPPRLNLVELGPGRGTLMQDALRASKKVAGFRDALSVHLVETSAAMRERQRAALTDAGASLSWHAGLRELPRGATVLIANEVLDTCSVSQIEVAEDGAYARGVGIDDAGELHFVRLAPRLPVGPQLAAAGAILETQDFALLPDLRRLATGGSFAGLFIDYGHTRSACGDTLQAVRDHRPEHALCSPGEADLSVHVDFARFRALIEARGEPGGRPAGLCDGPVTQAEFLGRLGIMERADRLMAANPAQAHVIETAVARLMSPTGMGVRFKALGVRSPGMAPLPGLEQGLSDGTQA